MTYMWQEERGKPFYRFQTDERDIANKMKRRNKFNLSSWGVNCSLWIYQTTFLRPDIARKTFKTLTGGNIEFDDREEIYYSVTYSSDIEKLSS